MGSFRFRKSVKLGPGVRLNISRRSLGISGGVPGARVSYSTSGRRTTSVGLPGSGVRYQHSQQIGRRQPSRNTLDPSRLSLRREVSAAVAPPALPKPGIFAPKHEKRFAKAMEALLADDRDKALRLFREASVHDTSERAVADDLFAGLLTAEAGNLDEAISYLESVVASETELPDELMIKYRIGGSLPLTIGHVEISVPWSSAAAALALASAYETTGRIDEAIGVVQQLAATDEDPILLLALCDLYAETCAWDEIVEAAAGTRNDDDVTLQLRLYQARALREQGMNEAALEAYKDALRSKKRHPDLLKEARYERGRLLLQKGKRAQAMRDLQTVYADDPTYRDVADLVVAGTM